MTAEQFLWTFIKSEVLYPKRLTYQSESLYYTCMEDVIKAGERTGGDGTMAFRKKEQKKKWINMKWIKEKKERGDAFD